MARTKMSDIKRDFRNFVFEVWKHLGLPAPTVVQYEVAHYLQFGPRRQIIEAYRGMGKSWITSAFVLWSLLKDPQAKFLIVSASKQRADDFSSFTMRLINEMPMLQHLIPKEEQRNSKIAFDVGPAKPAHAPSVKSVGVFGQMSGSRATHIIADDVEVPNNSATQDMREKLLKAVLEFEAIFMPETGRITYLGTPQTEESIYNELWKRGYEVRIWPARHPAAEKLKLYEGRLAPSILEAVESSGGKAAGQPTDPKRFGEMELTEREGVYGRSGFALQFMLDTSLSDADRYPLKLSDLIVMGLNTDKAPLLVTYGNTMDNQLKDLPNIGFTGDRFYKPIYVDKEWTPYEGSVLAIDPSGRGTDETAYVVVKQLHGFLYLLAAGGFKGGYDEETLVGLARVARDHKVNLVLVEENFGQGMFARLFQPVLNKFHRCSIEEVRQTVQKEKRLIDVLEPVMNRHKLIVDYDLVRADLEMAKESMLYSMFYQMTRLTRDRGALKHDDRIDVLGMAVAYWVEAVGRDEQQSIEDWKQKQIDEALEEFMDSVFTSPLKSKGRPKGRDQSWMKGPSKVSVVGMWSA